MARCPWINCWSNRTLRSCIRTREPQSCRRTWKTGSRTDPSSTCRDIALSKEMSRAVCRPLLRWLRRLWRRPRKKWPSRPHSLRWNSLDYRSRLRFDYFVTTHTVILAVAIFLLNYNLEIVAHLIESSWRDTTMDRKRSHPTNDIWERENRSVFQGTNEMGVIFRIF